MNLTSLKNRHCKKATAAVATLLAAPALSACGGDAEAADVAIVDTGSDEIQTATFIANGENSVMEVTDGIWTPRSGNSDGAILLDANEDRIFPTLSYRILPAGKIDHNDPQFGLTRGPDSAPLAKECGSGCGLEVTSKDGKTWKVTVGTATFNDAGFYAKVDGDPKTYLLTRQTVGDIISIATGTQFTFPPTKQIAAIDTKLEEVGSEEGEGPNHHPFLTQVLAAEEAAKAEAEGRETTALEDAATSTEDVAGARDNEAAQQQGGPQQGGQPQGEEQQGEEQQGEEQQGEEQQGEEQQGDGEDAGVADAIGNTPDDAEEPIERGSQAGDVQ